MKYFFLTSCMLVIIFSANGQITFERMYSPQASNGITGANSALQTADSGYEEQGCVLAN